MKQLQNNYTTPEQSKRLLELGLPADSADCYLLRTFTKGDTFIVEVLHDELYSEKAKFTNLLEYLPCWSVGRLIEIELLCREQREGQLARLEFIAEEFPDADKISGNIMESLIRYMESALYKYDFSKLGDEK